MPRCTTSCANTTWDEIGNALLGVAKNADVTVGNTLLLAGLIARGIEGGAEDGAWMVETVIEGAQFELRQRRLAGAFGLTTGAVQVSAGALLIADGRSSAIARAGRIQVIGGGASIVLGLTTLIQPGPLARLERTDAFRELLDHPTSPWIAATFERAWADTARRVRRFRLIGGGISIAAGAVVTTMGTVRAIVLRGEKDHTILDFSMLATGAGLLGTGVTSVVLESEVERAYKRQALRRKRARVSVGPGTLTVSGHF